MDVQTVLQARVILINRLHNLERSEPNRFTPAHAGWRNEMSVLYNQIDEVTAELPDADWLACRGLQ